MRVERPGCSAAKPRTFGLPSMEGLRSLVLRGGSGWVRESVVGDGSECRPMGLPRRTAVGVCRGGGGGGCSAKNLRTFGLPAEGFRSPEVKDGSGWVPESWGRGRRGGGSEFHPKGTHEELRSAFFRAKEHELPSSGRRRVDTILDTNCPQDRIQFVSRERKNPVFYGVFSSGGRSRTYDTRIMIPLL